MNQQYQSPLEYLRQAMNNPDANFRDGQDKAIARLLAGERLLVIQATGWGKSMVYFISAKMRRLAGFGPTLLISPLLALMRNQLVAATRLGLTAATINSANKEEWPQIFNTIKEGLLDVILISPERLANQQFRQEILELLASRIGLLVIDEAHCISDWGHEFRPDYRRLKELLPLLPKDLPVLATTATANERVINDIKEQLGSQLTILRGSLLRKSLKLQNLIIPERHQRLAWLAQLLPRLPGSGLVYALTTKECELIACWLRSQGINAEAYHAKVDQVTYPYSKEQLEEMLQQNQLKCLVCTIALGMGFDKPDLGFVVHYQRPASVVHYYQQVGRAGRGSDTAYGILASGREDDDVSEFFIANGFPEADNLYDLLQVFEEIDEPLSARSIAELLDIPEETIQFWLKFLSVAKDPPLEPCGTIWQKTAHFYDYRFDKKYREQIQEVRLKEEREMSRYMTHRGCLMNYMQEALGEENPTPCGRCYNCAPESFPIVELEGDLLAQAAIFRHRWYEGKAFKR